MKFTQSLHQVDVKKEWIVIDATDRIYGRLMTEVATILRGKNKPNFTPNIDCGDNVVIINAGKVKFTGAKLADKNYYTHSGHFGSTKTHKMADMLANNPERLFKLGARGMLPKTKLGAKILKNLKVYDSAEHPHTAQVQG
jgi:large subunit ribosomal protein L13